MHGLWTGETTKVERCPNDEQLSSQTSRPERHYGLAQISNPGLPHWRIFQSVKSAESINLGKLNLEKRYVRLRGCELQPVRGDLLCDSFVAHDSFLPPAATQGSIRLDAATMAAGAAWQSIAVFPVVHQTQLCQGALQGVAPGRRPGIRPR